MSKHTPGYEVTRDGRVFSVASNWRGYGRREMTQTLNAGGYPSVRLVIDGKRTRIAVHRLVARYYLPPLRFGADRNAATRRAIVRAAAAIAKTEDAV